MRSRAEAESLYRRSVAEDGPGALSTAMYHDMLQRLELDHAHRLRGWDVWTRLHEATDRDGSAGKGGRRT